MAPSRGLRCRGNFLRTIRVVAPVKSLDASLSAIERAIVIRLENRRIRKLARAGIEERRGLLAQLSAVREQLYLAPKPKRPKSDSSSITTEIDIGG